GKSLPKDQDPEQGLSEQGILDVERIANTAKSYKICVSNIKHSGKKRAKQTAEIFAKALNPKNGVQEMKGLSPLDDVAEIIGKINIEDNIMLVGHLPFMERLVSYLITGDSDKTVFKFQNGGIVCLDQDEDSWFIKWSLTPNIYS
ncbi:phosphohistidine phosphatase SixA, partial [bacterium]